MNQDQINSLVRTALKVIAGAILAHGGSQMLAGAINTPDVAELVTGIIIAGLSAWASHATHAEPSSSTTTQQQSQTTKP
jgi:hypothetical protein